MELAVPDLDSPLAVDDRIALERRVGRHRFLKGNSPSLPVEFVEGEVHAHSIEGFDETAGASTYTTVHATSNFDPVTHHFDFDLLTSHGFDVDLADRSETLLYSRLDYTVPGSWIDTPGRLLVRPDISLDGSAYLQSGMSAEPTSWGSAWLMMGLQLFRENCSDPIDCAGYSGGYYLFGAWAHESWGLHSIAQDGPYPGIVASLDVDPGTDVTVRIMTLAGTLVQGPGCVTTIAVTNPDFVGFPAFQTDFHPYVLRMADHERRRYPGETLTIPEDILGQIGPTE